MPEAGCAAARLAVTNAAAASAIVKGIEEYKQAPLGMGLEQFYSSAAPALRRNRSGFRQLGELAFHQSMEGALLITRHPS